MNELFSFSNLVILSIGILTIIFIIYKQFVNRAQSLAQQNRKLFFESLNLSNHDSRYKILGFFHPYW